MNDTHREKLLNCFTQLVEEFIEIEAWLLLTFFICLHNELSSIHSIVTNQTVQMLEIGDSSNRQKINGCLSIKFYGKI